MSLPLCVPSSAEKLFALLSYVPLFSVSWLKRPETCPSKIQLQSPTLLCANSNWSLSSPKASQTRKSLLT